jgi:DNA-binding NarL/FixJ family response regulator
VRQIRIAISDKPDQLHDLVQQGLAAEPDLAFVAVASNEVALLLEAARVDVVVVAMRHGEMPAVAERLLDEYPRVGVVGVDIEAGSGAVYRLRPSLAAIHEVTPEAIVAAIRCAAENSNGWGNQ